MVGRRPRVPVTAQTRRSFSPRGPRVLRGTAPACCWVCGGAGTLIICHHSVGVQSSQKGASLVLDLAEQSLLQWFSNRIPQRLAGWLVCFSGWSAKRGCTAGSSLRTGCAAVRSVPRCRPLKDTTGPGSLYDRFLEYHSEEPCSEQSSSLQPFPAPHRSCL